MIVALCSTASAVSGIPLSVPGGDAIVNENFSAVPAELQMQILANEELTAVARYAYMDITIADQELKDAILTARKIVIYSQAWVADGYLLKDLDGNIVSVPKFSYLFPGWDIPVERASGAILADAASNSVMADAPPVEWFNGSYDVPAAGTQNAPIMAGGTYFGPDDYGPMIDFNGMTGGGRCNLGFSKLVGYDFVSVFWAPNRYAGTGLMLSPTITEYGAYYGARVSTYDTPGLGNFWVGFYND